MAKRSSTVYLEEKFWEMIDKYQSDNNVSSRNDAFQMVLQEWSILTKIDFNNIKVNVNIGSIEGSMISNANLENTPRKEMQVINNEPEEKKTIDPRMTNALFQIANTMKKEE